MLINKEVDEYLDILASDRPSPGGGSAAALSGALGMSLLQMVCNLSIYKKGLEDHQEDIEKIMAISLDYYDFFKRAIDKDSKAFGKVINAFRMPKKTDQEKDLRRNKIQEGYKHAASVPMEVGMMAYRSFDLLEDLVDISNHNAITDIAVASLELDACIKSAFYNVKINLSYIKDKAYRARLIREMNKIEEDFSKRLGAILAKVDKIMGL